MLKKIYLLAFFSLLVCYSNNLQAQGIAIGPQLGYQRARDADDGDLMYGAALRARFESFGAEASINYRQETFDDGDVTVRTWPVMVTALLYPLPFLYGSIGAGWFHTTFDFADELDTESRTETNFGWHFGGGLEIGIGSFTRVALDIRYVFLDYDFRELPGRDIDSDFYVITIGVLFGY